MLIYPVITYLFVYVSLKKKFDLPYSILLRENSELISEGAMNAVMYRIDSYPAAVLSEELDAWVKGEIYLLKPDSDILTMLDEYEGFSLASPGQSEFIRLRRPIRLSDGSWLTCWVYLYNYPLTNLTQIQNF